MGIGRLLQNGRDRLRRKVRKRVLRMTERLRPVVLQNQGFCPICEREVSFVARDPWLRDHYKCSRCRSIPRERALMLVIQQRYPNWRDLRIHESSPGNRGASKRFAEECREYIPTHFFPGSTPGSIVNGYRCENLEALTFGDETIDLHITQDVLEHVLRPERAFAEIARTLRPGGAHIFTVPLVNKEKASTRRVEVDASGALTHVLAPEYHVNPVSAEGSLVTTDWGFDIRDHIAAASGLDAEIICIDDLSKGIRAEYIEVLVTTKARNNR
jgi:SAM-dependent methyltransferase